MSALRIARSVWRFGRENRDRWRIDDNDSKEAA